MHFYCTSPLFLLGCQSFWTKRKVWPSNSHGQKILYRYWKLTAFLTLRRPLRRKLRMSWFFDVSKVKASSFFKSNLTDSPQRLLENTNLTTSELKTLKKLCFDKEKRKNGQVRIDTCSQSWKSSVKFTALSLAEEIMTSWERQRRDENFGDDEF